MWGGGGDPEMWKYFIAIEGPGVCGKISLAYRRSGEGDVESLCCHKWFRVCTSINLHCHRRSIGRL